MSGKMLAEVISSFSLFGEKKAVKTTSFSFRLLTTYSAGLISIFIFVILMNRFYGDAMECFPSDTKYRMAMQLKCWMEGVHHDYSLVDRETIVEGKHVLKHGVGHNNKHSDIERVTFKYYQWIIPMLILQSFIFYLPHAFWKARERSTMFKLLGGAAFPIFSKDWENQKKNLLAYLTDVRAKYHRWYALQCLLSEVMSLVCLIFNILMTKWIIQHAKGSFWTGYAPAVFNFITGDMDGFNYYAARFFPTQGKCDFDKYGVSGTIEQRDALCIMPQNVIIDKIFVFIYIWYAIALVCGIINMVYLIIMFVSSILRVLEVGQMLERTATVRYCKELTKKGDFGIWFTLKIYRRNLVPIQFQDICKQLHILLKNDGKMPIIIENNNDLNRDDLERF